MDMDKRNAIMIVAGLGCRKGSTREELLSALDAACTEAGISRSSIAAHKVSKPPMIAGVVTAGKSRSSTDGPQMPTATSQK